MNLPSDPAARTEAPSGRWLATYRLQLNSQFTLYDATKALPYLKELGISHVYLSPCLEATPGSGHGYDVADPAQISRERGGAEGFSTLAQTAKELGLGLLLDIVPNHMTTHGSNHYLQDILAHGRMSRHCNKFDHHALGADNKPITLCTLGGPYGRIVENLEIKIAIDDGRLRVRYYEHDFPVCPESWDMVLGRDDGPMSQKCERLRQLQRCPDDEQEQAREEYAAVVESLDAAMQKRIKEEGSAIEQRLAEINRDPNLLDAIVSYQHFRLMWWKLEGEFINYRRFFNIGSLISVKMEDPEVFAWGHQQVRRLIDQGQLAGLRVDHPDGLEDPKTYFDQLRALLPDGRIYVEKILEDEETLPGDWQVDGTVGYDFLNRVNRLWMDETRTEALTSVYSDFTEHPTNYQALVREQKQFILEQHFRSDLERLVALGVEIAVGDFKTRDISRRDLEHGIVQLIVALPIYRTYLSDSSNDESQRDIISEALAQAQSLTQPLTESRTLAFEFLRGTLLNPLRSQAQRDFLARFQQLSPAVMAKGAEDTSFYRYDRLVSCNEVGAQPANLGISAEQFHQYLSHLKTCWPNNMLTTSTHDTKRSGDVRARISVLTEMPETWHKQVFEWAEHNAPAWKGREHDRHAEYLLYQTLVGAHPLSAERAFQYMQKAVREAKIYTSWHEPNAVYEDKLKEFVDTILADPEFRASLQDFVQPLIHPGRINSLAQILIKLTAPGTPDFYQGSEIWDLTLVDPDNRRPVDFTERAQMLARVRSCSVGDLEPHWDSGLVKLWMMDRALSARRRVSNFEELDYRPLIAGGENLRHVLAYARGEELVVVVPRFWTSIEGHFDTTEIHLPEGLYQCAFSGTRVQGVTSVGEIFKSFPVALLEKVIDDRRPEGV